MEREKPKPTNGKWVPESLDEAMGAYEVEQMNRDQRFGDQVIFDGKKKGDVKLANGTRATSINPPGVHDNGHIKPRQPHS